MADPNSCSTPLENTQDEFGSASRDSAHLPNAQPNMDLSEQVWFSAESKRISDSITKLENGLVSKKDKEIEQLRAQLYHLGTKAVNLKRYLLWENKEIGNLLWNLAEMGSKGFSSRGAVLNVGPFNDGNEVDEFQRMLKELAMQMRSGVDKKNLELLTKINHVFLKTNGLGIPANPTATSTATGTGYTTENGLGPIPHFGTLSSTNQVTASTSQATASTNQATASTNQATPSINHRDLFIKAPGMPNRAIPLWSELDCNSVFTLPERDELHSINSSVVNFKHGMDLTKLDMGHFCLCGMKLNSAENLFQHLMATAEQ